MFRVGDILGLRDGRANTYKVREVRDDGRVRVNVHTDSWGHTISGEFNVWYSPDIFWLAGRDKKSNEDIVQARKKELGII